MIASNNNMIFTITLTVRDILDEEIGRKLA
jgi:hypothetical protein